MTIRLVAEGWDQEFTEALDVDAKELRIICPFVKADVIECLLARQPGKVQVITRFNLADFAEGVSDVTALQKLLEAGARVRGIRNLHAKLYVFGTSRAIITSANLTRAALTRNLEFGVIADDKVTIRKCRSYFDDLWCAGNDAQLDEVKAWEETVMDHRLGGGRSYKTPCLGDFGADAGIEDPPTTHGVSVAVANASQAFVKFLGKSSSRIPLSTLVFEEVKKDGCHWAAHYPASKRPKSVRDGDIIFMGRFTKDPNDIRVFGRATGMKHKPGRDDATAADIEKRPWKKDYPRYVRVYHAEFVAGRMRNGVSLNELMDALGPDSFASTQINVSRGEGNTNPRRAYPQQAAVKLSPDGFSWLSVRLQEAFETYGKISKARLDKLDWPDASILSSLEEVSE